MNDSSASTSSDQQPAANDARLGRLMSLAIAALFVMVIVSVLGVLWVAKRNRERVARFNNFGSAPAEVQKPATR